MQGSAALADDSLSHIRQTSEVLETIVRVSAQIQGEVQQLNSQLGRFRT